MINMTLCLSSSSSAKNFLRASSSQPSRRLMVSLLLFSSALERCKNEQRNWILAAHELFGNKADFGLPSDKSVGQTRQTSTGREWRVKKKAWAATSLHGWQVYAQGWAGSPFCPTLARRPYKLWRAAGKPLPPTVGGKDFPFFFFSPLPCKKQTEFVKKICTIKSWKTYLWQSMETTLSLMGISVCLGHL